jgi:hypothetical protein
MPDQYSKYQVPKVQERKMKVAAKRGGVNDAMIDTPNVSGVSVPHSGASKDPMFGREFNATDDLQTLLRANAVRADRARLGKALALKERLVTGMNLKNTGSAHTGVNEIKGPNNAGRLARNNPYDQRTMTRVGTTGRRGEGGKGRW